MNYRAEWIRGSTGSWVTIDSEKVVEILSNFSFDWLTIDLEHSCISESSCERMIRVIQLKGKRALVRCTSKGQDQIKRVLDAGADGIIVPMVNSADDVDSIVNAMFYPPLGRRSVGLARCNSYGDVPPGHDVSSGCPPALIVQIEHIDAVKNLDSILSCPLISGFMIGPYDLSASIGIPGDFNNPTFLSLINEIEGRAIPHEKFSGFHIVDFERDKHIADKKEYDFLAIGLDSEFLRRSLKSLELTYRKRMKNG
jgi:2-keto-3-deoxy-L-rhamnonate aldolase RhmA